MALSADENKTIVFFTVKNLVNNAIEISQCLLWNKNVAFK